MVTIVIHSDGRVYTFAGDHDMSDAIADDIEAFASLCKLRRIKPGDEILRLINERHDELLGE